MSEPRFPEYFHDLDAARGVLMVLGIFLHAASVYLLGVTWLVNDPVDHIAFNYINATIHIFRMPAFFVVAGFFALWSVRRYGARGFLQRRLVRLGVPLAATVAVVNLFEAYVLAARQTSGLDILAFLERSFPQWLVAGEWVGHLWFLVVLVVYVVLLAMGAANARLVRSMSRGVACLGEKLPSWVADTSVWLFVLPLTSFVGLAAAKVFPDLHIHYGTLSGYTFLEYLPFFVFGLLLAASPRLFEGQLKLRWWVLLIIAAAYAAPFVMPRETVGLAAAIGQEYVRQLLIWSASLFVLALFHRFCLRERPFFSRLAEAALTIYLFHHLVVVVLGSLMIGTGIALWMKYTVIVIATFAITWVIHLVLVAPLPLVRFLFNGQRPRATDG